MLQTSNAECAWTKGKQLFYKGIRIIVIKKKLLGSLQYIKMYQLGSKLININLMLMTVQKISN